ncbi:MAG: hypothetical protein EOO01_02050 [Chitinophagaceae bacterium]|nr:MAG: hypothetical protein EOO01_02050 [Chitinophagaceae bacterium]
MKKILFLSFIAFIIIAMATEDATAQRFTAKKRYRTIGVSINAMNYFGDIVPESDFTSLRFKSTRPNIGVNYSMRLYPRITVRGNFFWGRITGDDAKAADPGEADNKGRYNRNLSFRNDIKELSGTVMIDLFENRGNYLRRPDLVPYVFVGVGVMHHNPKAYWGGGYTGENTPDLPAGWYELQPLGTEGQNIGGDYPDKYSLVQIVIPAGLGLRYKLDRNWDISFEIGWRKTFTDYLDDVSGTYADKNMLLQNGGLESAVLSDRSGYNPQSIQNGVVNVDEDGIVDNGLPWVNGYGKDGSQRGDKSDKDWYIVTGFSLNYILNPSVRSPKFR